MNIIDSLLEGQKYGEQDPAVVRKFESLRRAGVLSPKQVAFGESIIRKTTPKATTVINWGDFVTTPDGRGMVTSVGVGRVEYEVSVDDEDGVGVRKTYQASDVRKGCDL